MSAPFLIDDGDSAVQYSAGWVHDLGFQPAVYHTRHGAVGKGSSVSLTFVEVVTTLDPTPQGGRPTTSYTIDGSHVATVTAPFAPNALTQFNITTFSKNGLPPGSHVLNITNMNGTSPNIFWIDYFLVYDPPASRPQESMTATHPTTIPIGSDPATTHSVTPISSSTPTAHSWSSYEPSESIELSSMLPRLTTATLSGASSGSITTTGDAFHTTTASTISAVDSNTTPSRHPASEEPSPTVTLGAVPSDAADTSHRPRHNFIPAAVGGSLGGIIIVSVLVALVFLVRRRSRSRRLDIDASKRDSCVSDEGWLPLRSKSDASVREMTRTAVSVLGDERPLSGSSEYASALQHSRDSRQLLGTWPAL
ncbi:hypothetical protein OH76DRAFT_716961 [Lentinus brumalis]|uniref:Uncharacterized protein n=1 Tax=Lentinus brumalis TaxID=2498619 RepID=A0A371D5I2_9APHY|nr:hypothetical protein OH76DRAFT_716961 [Polyporus brumalis]